MVRELCLKTFQRIHSYEQDDFNWQSFQYFEELSTKSRVSPCRENISPLGCSLSEVGLGVIFSFFFLILFYMFENFYTKHCLILKVILSRRVVFKWCLTALENPEMSNAKAVTWLKFTGGYSVPSAVHCCALFPKKRADSLTNTENGIQTHSVMCSRGCNR